MVEGNSVGGPREWPASKVEMWPVSRLKPYPRNTRLHSPSQIRQIAESIKEFGWAMPLLVAPDGTLICGHARLSAARELGLQSIPVMVAEEWTAEQRRAYSIADNKIASNSKFDEDMLVMELGELAESGIDLNIVGFSKQEMDSLLDGWKPDEVIEEPEIKRCPHCGMPLES